MQFVVKFREGASRTTSLYPHVVLVQDNWDDYGYRSTFDATLHLSPEDRIELGNIKIIEADRTSGYTEMPRTPFDRLSPKHASLGADLDYYEKLYRLGPEIYESYFEGLRDVAYDDEAKGVVEDTEGYQVSLLRFSGAERTIQDARNLLRARERPARKRAASFIVRFRTRVARDAETFRINFDFQRVRRLPSRINALIGYNGTGKTRLLSNLAIVASGYGYSTKEDMVERAAGRFIGTQPPFKTVMVVSYSAFDTFVIPGRSAIERRKIETEGGIFGYVYCGLRERSDEEGPDGEQAYRLQTPAEIERQFLVAVRRIRRSNRRHQFQEILRPLLRDPSFLRIGLTPLYADRDLDEVGSLFRELSSGHKVVLKIIAELTAYIAGSEPSLVLIDEPETHLHPPLLAAFLKSVRSCIETFDGYAIIATHSPVVLQETPARYVQVLRRNGDRNVAVEPTIETFAESIGVITQEVFNLGDGSTDWHDTLRRLARNRSLEQIEEMLGRPLGFAARSYILSIQEEFES